MLVSAIHHHESSTGIQRFPPSWTPSHHPPLWIGTEHQVELPMLSSNFTLAIYFTRGDAFYFSATLNPSHPLLPLLCPFVRSLCPSLISAQQIGNFGSFHLVMWWVSSHTRSSMQAERLVVAGPVISLSMFAKNVGPEYNFQGGNVLPSLKNGDSHSTCSVGLMWA